MDFVIENILLREIVIVVNENEAFYADLISFLSQKGYDKLLDFVNEPDDDKGKEVILGFLRHDSAVKLYDGAGNPYKNAKARWFFLSWLFRDAPAQRLAALVKQMEGDSPIERQASLLNELRKHVRLLFPNESSWEWPALSEVLIQRLEGSRRALRGTLFVVRRCLADLFEKEQIELRIGDNQIRIETETYDVQVYGLTKQILIPVKTRETMGGGHASLFTRDIAESIRVAEKAGHRCIPVVIAESWAGNLDGLACASYIYIQKNPNQLSEVESVLAIELAKLSDVFRQLS